MARIIIECSDLDCLEGHFAWVQAQIEQGYHGGIIGWRTDEWELED